MRVPRFLVSSLFLVAVNAVPLVGVLFFGWSLFSIVLLYWLENGVIGAFNVFKIRLADKPAPSGSAGSAAAASRSAGLSGSAFYVPFFLMHYGIFWVVHGVFVIVFFGLLGGVFFGPSELLGGFRDFQPVGLLVALAGLTVSHGVSFFFNFVGRQEYLNTTPDAQMLQPYGRVVVLHLTIIGGALLSGFLGTPLTSLVLMVVLKTAVDLFAHLREHRKAAVPSDAGASG